MTDLRESYVRYRGGSARPFTITGGYVERTALSVSQVRGMVQGIQRNDPTRDVAVSSERSGVFAVYGRLA